PVARARHSRSRTFKSMTGRIFWKTAARSPAPSASEYSSCCRKILRSSRFATRIKNSSPSSWPLPKSPRPERKNARLFHHSHLDGIHGLGFGHNVGNGDDPVLFLNQATLLQDGDRFCDGFLGLRFL